jgi:hypothetical protein
MAAPLSTLRAKLARRKTARDRQSRLWKKTGKRGHARAAKRHVRAIRKLRRFIKREIARRPESGTGAWGGSRSIINNEVVPVAKRFGAPITSRKRAADHPLTIANPSSDHSVTNSTADAIDLASYSGDELARAIAENLGISGYRTGTFDRYTISRADRSFSVQILWAVDGHFDHVHVGIRRV